jgi:chromosome segregation ATPase
MTNKKKNKELLVASDDDPTAEFEQLVLSPQPADDDSEASATTSGYIQNGAPKLTAEDAVTDLKSDLLTRSEIVDRLKFEMEILRAKWQGLSIELEAREEQAKHLNHELDVARQALQRNENRISERDADIESLQAAVANRDEANRVLAAELDKVQSEIVSNGPDRPQKEQRLAVQAGQLASRDLENRELQLRIDKFEDYADQLRYQLRLKDAVANNFGGQIDVLSHELDGANRQIAALQLEIDDLRHHKEILETNITDLHSTHAEEIRMIRFELGDAQETLSQHELVAEQLASDLVQTRSKRKELESELTDASEKSQTEIRELKKEKRRLLLEADAMREKLQTKSEAINCLLAELAKSPQPVDPVAELEGAIQDIDEHMSERIEERAIPERDRVTRLLTGHIDGQKLRFPLFKDRLTIGRTSENDIQLKSEHVSRRHAVIVIEGDVSRLIDWGSKNGVYVNSRRIKEHFLKNGDVVSVGTAEFRYEERPKRDGQKNLSG